MPDAILPVPFTLEQIEELSREYPTPFYVYDGVGNLLSKTCGVEITSYSYDANNMIKSIQLPIGETLSFEYDALGRRVKKVYDNRITWYSYGLSDSPLLENHNN